MASTTVPRWTKRHGLSYDNVFDLTVRRYFESHEAMGEPVCGMVHGKEVLTSRAMRAACRDFDARLLSACNDMTQVSCDARYSTTGVACLTCIAMCMVATCFQGSCCQGYMGISRLCAPLAYDFSSILATLSIRVCPTTKRSCGCKSFFVVCEVHQEGRNIAQRLSYFSCPSLIHPQSLRSSSQVLWTMSHSAFRSHQACFETRIRRSSVQKLTIPSGQSSSVSWCSSLIRYYLLAGTNWAAQNNR